MTTDIDRLCSFDGGGLKRWNYSDANKEGYIPETITGDLVEIQFPQKRSYSPNNPGQGNLEFWPDGNPKRNILFIIRSVKTGQELGWEFTPSKNSVAKQAVIVAMQKAIADGIMPESKTIKDLCPGNGVGYNVTIATQPGTYGAGNARPWAFAINEKAKNPEEVRGVTEPQPVMQQNVPMNNVPMNSVPAIPNNPVLNQAMQGAMNASMQNNIASSDIDF